MRKSFVTAVTDTFSTSDQPVLLLGDIGVFGFSKLGKEFPSRVINVGILEQAMVGIAAGLAMKNYIPTIHTIAPFMVERAFEQIKVDFAYQGLAGNLVSVGASFDYAALGCTHHCPADISLMSSIPGTRIYLPGNQEEFLHQYSVHWNDGHLNYFRLSESSHSVDLKDFKSGACKVKNGARATVIVVGPILQEAFEALKDLDLDILYMNNLDHSTLTDLTSRGLKKDVIVIEPYYSGTVANLLIENNLLGYSRIHQIGVPREFLNHYGSASEHMAHLKLAAAGIRDRVEKILND